MIWCGELNAYKSTGYAESNYKQPRDVDFYLLPWSVGSAIGPEAGRAIGREVMCGGSVSTVPARLPLETIERMVPPHEALTPLERLLVSHGSGIRPSAGL